jgi:hypothetical protein
VTAPHHGVAVGLSAGPGCFSAMSIARATRSGCCKLGVTDTRHSTRALNPTAGLPRIRVVRRTCTRRPAIRQVPRIFGGKASITPVNSTRSGPTVARASGVDVCKVRVNVWVEVRATVAVIAGDATGLAVGLAASGTPVAVACTRSGGLSV